MTLVAIEEHWMLPDLAAALGATPQPDESLLLNDHGDTAERLTDLAEGRLAVMDAQGVDVAILSLTPPGTQALAPAAAVRLSRAANDTAAEAVRRHPTRFRFLSSLPLASPEHAADELRRAADLGAVGAMVYGRSGALPLDDPALEDVLATAAALHQPVFLHPQIPPDALRAAAYRGFEPLVELGLATFGWGWHVEAATAALRLILRGTFDRHPDLRVVLGHWGELLLFWLDRADSLARIAGLRRSVSEYVREHFWITASGMLNPALLDHVRTVTTPDRLLFSTDYPFQQPSREEITAFLQHLGDGEREAFTSGNASRLFRL